MVEGAEQLVGAARQRAGADPVGDLGDSTEPSGGDSGVIERGEVDLDPRGIDWTANSSNSARASSRRDRRVASATSASASTSMASASAHRSPRVRA